MLLDDSRMQHLKEIKSTLPKFLQRGRITRAQPDQQRDYKNAQRSRNSGPPQPFCNSHVNAVL
jgi:hypothetical protein